MANFPYPIFGVITATDSSTPSTRVTFRNDRTGESVNATSNTSGKYLEDAANFASGYMTTDRVTIIVGYGSEEGSDSILLSSDTHNVDITLAEIASSTDTTYCSIQDVLDFLGDKTTDDISYERIRKIILRAEDEIEDRTGTHFKSTTETDEIHDFNQYTSYSSPERMARYGTSQLLSGTRRDYSGMNFSDSIKLKYFPVISITSLYTNSAGASATDVWTERTEQEGSAGDFIMKKTIGLLQFVANLPYYGKRRIKVTYVHGYSTVPKIVEKQSILLSVRDVILSKRTESQFDGSQSINLGGEINISKFDSPTYLNFLNEEIERGWKSLGEFIQSIV